MADFDQETQDGPADALLRALAKTPAVMPFEGTDRYRVCACLGEGGFGVVYEVEDRQLGRRLALKTLKQHRVGYAANIRRLKREFRSVADLVHPNLVGLHELASEGPFWFFTMDLVRGADFLEYVCGKSPVAYAHTADASHHALPRRDTSGILSELRLRTALRQLVAGVGALHTAGIIHRDLKPSNVLVEPDGRVVIVDFGLAGSAEPVDREASVDFAGTPAYMAPEQATTTTLTPAADWYAVGVMLYEALTGRLPFDDPTPAGILRDKWSREAEPPSRFGRVPEDLERLCVALLQRKPEARPSGAAILELLGAAPTDSAEVDKGEDGNVFVGRGPELDLLRVALAEVRRGVMRVVRLRGQPGVGKSTLLTRFLSEARARGDAAVLAGSCFERESVPFKAFDGVADALARYLSALPRNEASALMPRDIHLATQLFPVLESVPALRDVPRRSTPRLDPTEVRSRAFAAIKELVARIADKQPLVIAIDDLQWGDADSARLLAHLIALPERPVALLVLSHRSDEAEQSESLRETLHLLEVAGASAIDVMLGPLPEADAERLAAELLGRTAAAAGATTGIAQRSEGHPLFIRELARALVLSGDSLKLPPSLVDMLWQRVLRLSESARAVLETLAVAGRPLVSSLCFEAAGLGVQGADAVRVLRAEHLVRSADGGLINVFHDRVREAVLMRSDAATRRMRHLALAVSLERSSPGAFEDLARHYDAAEQHDRAAAYAMRAGDAAARALAFDRAAALYRLAIDRAPERDRSAELYQKLGDALLHAGSNAPAGRAYLDAARRSEGRAAIDLTGRGAEQLLMVGEADTGLEAIDRALDAIGSPRPRSHNGSMLEGLYHFALMRLWRFRFREKPLASIDPELLLHLDVLQSAMNGLGYLSVGLALGVMMRFARAALNSGSPRHAAEGLTYACFMLSAYQRSRPPLIDEILDRADAIGQRLSDAGILGRSRRMRAETHYMFGNLRESLRLAEEAMALMAEAPRAIGVGQRAVRASAGLAHFKLGDLPQATTIANALLLDAIERDDAVAERTACVQVLAPLSLAADDPVRAREYVERVGLEDRCAMFVYRREAAADIAMYEGRPRDAVQTWRRGWATIEGEGLLAPPAFRVLVARSLGGALAASPESSRDLGEIRRMARSIGRLRFPQATATQLTLQAYLALHAGEPERALLHLLRAADDYESIGCVLDAAACRFRAGQVAGGREGAARAEAAETALRDRGIVSPERWVAMMVPPIATRRLAG
jgi:tetratricopeptide (TPR) repeat protein